MKDAVERGLSAVNDFVPEFMAGHAGRMEVYTYGPAGGEPRIASYDFGVHEIDGADVTEWVTEGATIVLSIQRRRRAEPAAGASTSAACATDSVGVAAQVLDQALETDAATQAQAAPAAHQASGEAQSGRESGLTLREVEVVELVVQGLSNRDIAEKCSLSMSSVESYVRSAYRRLDLFDRSTTGASRGRREPAMDPSPPERSTTPAEPYRSANGVVPRMQLAPGAEG